MRTQGARAVICEHPAANRAAEDGDELESQEWNDGEAEDAEGAKLHADVGCRGWHSVDLAKALDQAHENLRAGDERAAETEPNPLPGMRAAPDEIIEDDAVASGRDHALNLRGKIADDVLEKRQAAHDSESEEQHGEKGEEHVEGHGLAEDYAIRKHAEERLAEIFDHMSHDVCRIIKVSRRRRLALSELPLGERGVNFSRNSGRGGEYGAKCALWIDSGAMRVVAGEIFFGGYSRADDRRSTKN